MNSGFLVNYGLRSYLCPRFLKVIFFKKQFYHFLFSYNISLLYSTNFHGSARRLSTKMASTSMWLYQSGIGRVGKRTSEIWANFSSAFLFLKKTPYFLPWKTSRRLLQIFINDLYKLILTSKFQIPTLKKKAIWLLEWTVFIHISINL